MEFPDVFATTYLSGSAPRIKGGDLMALQREHIREWKALRGGDFLLIDDFVGTQVLASGSLWTATGAINVVGDAEATGVAQVGTTAAALHKLETMTLDFEQNPVRICGRVKSTVFGGSAFNQFLGLHSATAANRLGFYADSTNANWVCRSGAVDLVTTTPYSTTDYQQLEVRRVGASLLFIIDGVIVLSQTPTAVDLSNVLVRLLHDSTGGTANSHLDVDLIKVYCERQPIAGSVGGGAGGQHSEVQKITFAGAGAVVMAFNTPFGDTNYNVLEGGCVGAAPPTFSVVKSVGSMSITPTAAWNGTKTFMVFE